VLPDTPRDSINDRSQNITDCCRRPTCCHRCSMHSCDGRKIIINWLRRGRGAGGNAPITSGHGPPDTDTQTWSCLASDASSFQSQRTNTTPTRQSEHEALKKSMHRMFKNSVVCIYKGTMLRKYEV